MFNVTNNELVQVVKDMHRVLKHVVMDPISDSCTPKKIDWRRETTLYIHRFFD